jgi:hypothetical protein
MAENLLDSGQRYSFLDGRRSEGMSEHMRCYVLRDTCALGNESARKSGVWLWGGAA